MNKETSSRVSSIAGDILNVEPIDRDASKNEFNILLEKAKTLAGSALSQDETPGAESVTSGKIGAHGIHPAPAEFNDADIAADPILHFFHYAHLPPTLQETSKEFFLLAFRIVRTIPRTPERTVSLRKLLEAKEAAVRANLPLPSLWLDRDGAAPKLGGQRDLYERKPELGEAVEVGGHDEDRDGPVPFNG